MSSILSSPPANSILDLLSSPCFSFTSINSSLMINILRSLFSSMSFKSLINFNNSVCSFLSLSCSRPVNCLNLISTIALDWISVKLNSLIRLVLASSAFDEALIISITLSILSEAIINPSSIWARSSAFLKSNFVLLTTTSCLWSTKWEIISFKFKSLGLPLTNAILFTLKEDWSAVYLKSVFKTIFGIASLLRT